MWGLPLKERKKVSSNPGREAQTITGWSRKDLKVWQVMAVILFELVENNLTRRSCMHKITGLQPTAVPYRILSFKPFSPPSLIILKPPPNNQSKYDLLTLFDFPALMIDRGSDLKDHRSLPGPTASFQFWLPALPALWNLLWLLIPPGWEIWLFADLSKYITQEPAPSQLLPLVLINS